MKKINKIAPIVILFCLGYHFTASAQHLDTWRLRNEPKIIQMEKVLRIKPSSEVPAAYHDRLRAIQNNIKSEKYKAYKAGKI